MVDVYLSGSAGRIEGSYHYSDESDNVALILHPHSLHGGNMNSRVVFNIFKVLANSGFSVLRINFRGVGESAGTYDEGAGELSDAMTALDWLQSRHKSDARFWIVGFSFGAWIAMQLLMRRPEFSSFIAVSLPTNAYDFSFLSPCPASGLIVQGEADGVVKEESVMKLVTQINKQKSSKIYKVDYYVISGADHFFAKQIPELTQVVDDYVKRNKGGTNTLLPTKQDKRSKKPVAAA